MYLVSQNVLRDLVKCGREVFLFFLVSCFFLVGGSSFLGSSCYEECTAETRNKLKPLDPSLEVTTVSLSLKVFVDTEEDGQSTRSLKLSTWAWVCVCVCVFMSTNCEL